MQMRRGLWILARRGKIGHSFLPKILLKCRISSKFYTGFTQQSFWNLECEINQQYNLYQDKDQRTRNIDPFTPPDKKTIGYKKGNDEKAYPRYDFDWP